MTPTTPTPGAEPHQPSVVRLHVNLAPSVADALKSTAARHGLSLTEAVRHAVAVWKLISDAKADGCRVLIEDKDRNVREVVIV